MWVVRRNGVRTGKLRAFARDESRKFEHADSARDSLSGASRAAKNAVSSMMARREIFGLVAAGLMAPTLAACGSPSEASYRFRMTVEVDTPEGIKTGSSVMEVRINRGMAIGDRSGVSSQVRGEAVLVDLPSGPLFVLLKMPDAGPPLQSVVPRALLGRRSATPDAVMKDTAALGSTWFDEYRGELPREDWPLMVRFRNIEDPSTVERVDPGSAGVRRITVETTSDDVSTGIEERLPPWFAEMAASGARFSGNVSIAITSNSLADNLSPSSFSTEIRR